LSSLWQQIFKPSSDPKMHQRIRGATRTLCSLLAGEELMNKHYVCLFISAFKTPLFPTFHLPVSQHMKLAGRTQRPNATPAIVSVLGLHHDPWIVGLAPCQEGHCPFTAGVSHCLHFTEIQGRPSCSSCLSLVF
jgi:hypothetical protein